MSQASKGNRTGAVFGVRLSEEERDLLQRAMAAELEQRRKAHGWTYYGRPIPLGTFIRDAAIIAARRQLDEASKSLEAIPTSAEATSTSGSTEQPLAGKGAAGTTKRGSRAGTTAKVLRGTTARRRRVVPASRRNRRRRR